MRTAGRVGLGNSISPLNPGGRCSLETADRNRNGARRERNSRAMGSAVSSRRFMSSRATSHPTSTINLSALATDGAGPTTRKPASVSCSAISIAKIASSSTTRTRTLIAGNQLEKTEPSCRHGFQNILQGTNKPPNQSFRRIIKESLSIETHLHHSGHHGCPKAPVGGSNDGWAV